MINLGNFSFVFFLCSLSIKVMIQMCTRDKIYNLIHSKKALSFFLTFLVVWIKVMMTFSKNVCGFVFVCLTQDIKVKMDRKLQTADVLVYLYHPCFEDTWLSIFSSKFISRMKRMILTIIFHPWHLRYFFALSNHRLFIL